jgi:hypothetical protein
MKLAGARSWRGVWPVLLVAFNYWEDVLAVSREVQGTSMPHPAFCIRQLELPFSIPTFAKRFGDFDEDETCSRSNLPELGMSSRVKILWLAWRPSFGKLGVGKDRTTAVYRVYESVSAQEKVLQGLLRGPGSHITLQQT